MSAKPSPEKSRGGKFLAVLKAVLIRLPRFRLVPGLAGSATFLLVCLVSLGNIRSTSGGDFRNFEAGQVAGRDVLAEDDISYVDEEATELRIEAEERLVPGVFIFSPAVEGEVIAAWKDFTRFTGNLFDENVSAEAFKLRIQAEYPADFPNHVLDAYYADSDRKTYGESGTGVLENLLARGIFFLPHEGLEQYNPDVVELLTVSNSRNEWERISYRNILTQENLAAAVEADLVNLSGSSSFYRIAVDLIRPFIRDNVFFSLADTLQRVSEARTQVEPVIKQIEKGKRILKKGFVITDENMQELQALSQNIPGGDPRDAISVILILSLIYIMLTHLSGEPVLGRALSDQEIYLFSALTALYFVGTALLKNTVIGVEYLPVSVVIPGALLVMLPAILVASRLALLFAIVLPLGAYVSGFFDFWAFLFALVSGVIASCALEKAQKRMDLVKAGLLIAGMNSVTMIAILLARHAGPGVYPSLIFWAAFNGLASGMLVLGVLPPLEHALNAATAFRLAELSDLNSPVLRRLFTAAPGTYTHSIMVANLAEAACQDIGANPLLARVGAYYHDIGKTDNPDYFVENQTVYNKHDDIAPRLSATVIRSHVKLGAEKARALGLPQAVIDIIAEHHGNSVITWFYNKALKQEGSSGKSGAKAGINVEDFSYPGIPPRSRESAVVMLADVSEAASRTLEKPNASKLEKFIQELFSAKVEHGQLAQSELTFRDLETIKKAFVRVLAGYYHSRIEYPKLDKDILSREHGAVIKEQSPKEQPALKEEPALKEQPPAEEERR
jgi:putative nucleotidyltransferase with HDIG domain